MMFNEDVFQDASLPSSEEEEDTYLDGDTCTPFELAQSFPVKYKITDECAATLKKDYVLSLCHDSAFTRIAAGLSNASVQLIDVNDKCGLSHSSVEEIPAPALPTVTTKGCTNGASICGVRFLDESPNLLLVGTTNGVIRLFDLRASSKCEQALFEDTGSAPVTFSSDSGIIRSITCFDRNSNGRVICAGTDQYQNNVFLLFYDVRERKQLGGYFESHQDDITSVRFHAENPDLLCSGSTDGLINIFNIVQAIEEDALETTINTESSVHKLDWHRNVNDKDIISCITHTNDFKVYDCEEGSLIAEFSRCNITAALKRKNAANCNLVSSHDNEDGSVFLLSGTNFQKGDVLRSLRLQNEQLVPLADFDGNKQIVRESVYNKKNNVMVTAGESGIVSLWSVHASNTNTAQSSSFNKLKTKSKAKLSKKPY